MSSFHDLMVSHHQQEIRRMAQPNLSSGATYESNISAITAHLSDVKDVKTQERVSRWQGVLRALIKIIYPNTKSRRATVG